MAPTRKYKSSQSHTQLLPTIIQKKTIKKNESIGRNREVQLVESSPPITMCNIEPRLSKCTHKKNQKPSNLFPQVQSLIATRKALQTDNFPRLIVHFHLTCGWYLEKCVLIVMNQSDVNKCERKLDRVHEHDWVEKARCITLTLWNMACLLITFFANHFVCRYIKI